tara:strand:+ start:312 stop:506 length:195 start_codon:yes stop_codon:yes gene_type:complete
MTVTRIIPDGSSVTRVLPKPKDSGGSPTPPAPTTYPASTILVERLFFALYKDSTLFLASGWSYT